MTIPVLSAGLALLASSALAAGIEGTYRSEDGTQDMQIACRDRICQGTVVRARDSSQVGSRILRDLVPTSEGWSGTAVHPSTGLRLAATVSLPSPDQLSMTASKGFLRRTRLWKRVKE